jgi:hypothetical protein
MLELLGCRALLGVGFVAEPAGLVEEVEAAAAEEGQPTNMGMLDSEVDFIIGLGLGVM